MFANVCFAVKNYVWYFIFFSFITLVLFQQVCLCYLWFNCLFNFFLFLSFVGAGAWRRQAGCFHVEITLFTKVVWICSVFHGVCQCGFVHVWVLSSTCPIEGRRLAASLLQSPCSFVLLLFCMYFMAAGCTCCA